MSLQSTLNTTEQTLSDKVINLDKNSDLRPPRADTSEDVMKTHLFPFQHALTRHSIWPKIYIPTIHMQAHD